MITKLFSGLILATGLVAASIAGQNAAVTDTASCCKNSNACCSKDCCKDCPNCSCECECCKDCANGCECPNMKK